MDRISKGQRSAVMSSIRGSGTKPETRVREAIGRLGLWASTNRTDLPGRPDITVNSLKVALFVDGCFWHMHSCGKCKIPSSNREFWEKKLNGNAERDKRVRMLLESWGWRVVSLWECEVNLWVPEAVSMFLLYNFMGR